MSSDDFITHEIDFQKNTYQQHNLKLNSLITDYVKIITRFIGYLEIDRLKVSKQLLRWIDTFNPEIIYTFASSLNNIRFVNSLHTLTGLPITVHIVDDYISTMNYPGLFYFYWKGIINSTYKKLFNNATILLSICAAMSEEYEKRYQKKFHPFHNPIYLAEWSPFIKKDWSFTSTFRILYAGTLGNIQNKRVIEDISKVVDKLKSKEFNIDFEIFTISKLNSTRIKRLLMYKGTKINDPVPHSEIPKLLCSFDLLILPFDFTKKSVRYAKYSMPTKTAEYMISGVPTIVYASSETALVKYADSEDWAMTICEQKKSTLEEVIKNLYLNIEYREKIGKKAQILAIKNHDAKVVCEQFRVLLEYGINEKSV